MSKNNHKNSDKKKTKNVVKVPTYRIKLIFFAGIKAIKIELKNGIKTKDTNKFELIINKIFNLNWRYPGSNRKPFACKANTLPLRYTPCTTIE